MPDYYFPTPETYERLRSLRQGFYIEIGMDGDVVLLIKMEPALLMDIVKGCKIALVLCNPNINYRGCLIYIYDKPENPLYFSGGRFGEEDAAQKGLDKVMVELVRNHQQIKMVLFNELDHPVHTVMVPIHIEDGAFNQWLDYINNSEEFKYNDKPLALPGYDPMLNKQGFMINLLNTDQSAQEKITILSPEYAGKLGPYSNSRSGAFKFNNFQSDGKHGTLQELGISTHLDRFFQSGVDYFSSPRYVNGNEFTDYIIIDKNAAIFIESKYILSQKPTKKHQALHKAIVQLNKAEDVILENKLEQLEDNIKFALTPVKVVLKVCMLNDKIELDTNNTKALTAEFDKTELPLFMSLTTFINLLVSLSLKNEPFLRYNLFYNFITLFNVYHTSQDKILYKNSFSVEGLSAAELNQMGENRKG